MALRPSVCQSVGLWNGFASVYLSVCPSICPRSLNQNVVYIVYWRPVKVETCYLWYRYSVHVEHREKFDFSLALGGATYMSENSFGNISETNNARDLRLGTDNP